MTAKKTRLCQNQVMVINNSSVVAPDNESRIINTHKLQLGINQLPLQQIFSGYLILMEDNMKAFVI